MGTILETDSSVFQKSASLEACLEKWCPAPKASNRQCTPGVLPTTLEHFERSPNRKHPIYLSVQQFIISTVLEGRSPLQQTQKLQSGHGA